MTEFKDFFYSISDKYKLVLVKNKKTHVKEVYQYNSFDKPEDASLQSVGFFNIEDVSYSEIMGDTYIFELKIKWYTIQKKDETNYIIGLTRKQNICCVSELKKDIKRFTNCDDKFLKVYENYINQVLRDELFACQKTNYIGWNRNDDYVKYLGLYEHGNTLGYRYPNFFNNEVEEYKRMYETTETEDYASLLKMICSDKNILGIFAYTIHSLFYFYSEGEKHPDYDENMFSICIHGKEKEKVFLVSNLFSNVFEYDNENMYKLLPKSVISCSSIENTYVKYYRLESVPMIVTHKTNRITRNTSIIRTLHKGRRHGKIGFFPVYVSQCALNVDEIIDFSVDNIFIEKSLIEVKRQINSILVFFICFLEQLLKEENDEDSAKCVMESLYGNEIKRMLNKNPYIYHDIKAMSSVLLYIACRGFAFFLEHKLMRADLADMMMKQSKAYFLDNKPISTDQPYTDGIEGFLRYINNMLTQEEQERPFLCVISNEKRGGEKCIYIDYKKGYTSYRADCRQKQIVCLEYNAMLKHLKHSNLLKMRANQAQYLMQRTVDFKGKKHKQLLLVIFYDIFEQLLGGA